MAFTRIFKRNNIADHYEIPDMFKTLIKFMLTNFDDELRYINKEPFFQFYRQFNINMISRKEIKKNAPLIQSTPFDSIPKIFNFDIDLSPSYFELLLFLCGTEKPFQNMHDILNEVIPFYIRYIYYISFQFIHLDETKNDNTSVYNMSLFIDTIKKLIWLFFANQHDYFDECISAFSYLSFELCNLLKNNKNMKIKYKDFLLALPYVAEPLIAFLSNTYTQNINISPLIYFLSSMFSFIFEQNLANDQTMAIVFTYLCLFSKVPNIRMILDEESYISSYVFFIYLMGRENSSQIGIKQYVFVSLQNLLPLRVFRDNYKSMLSYEPLCSSIFQYIWQIVCHVNSNIEITLPKTDEKVEHSPAEYTGDISKLLISDFFTTNTPNKFSKKLPKFEMNIKFAKDITCMSFLSNVILFIKSDINFLYSLFSVFEQKQSCCDNPLHRMFMAFLLKELPSQMVLEFMNKGRLKALFNSKTINIIKYAQDPNLWMLFDSSVATFDLIHSLMNANNSIELKMTIAHLIQHIIRKNEYGSTSSILYFLSNIFKDISKDFGTILFNNDFIYALIFTDLVLIKELIVKRNDDLCFVHLCILKFFSLFLTRKISNIQMFYENVLGVPYYWTIIFDESTQNIGTKCMSQSYDVKGASKIVVESINTYFIDILKHNRVNIKIANLFQKFLNSMIQTIKSSTENFIETLQSTKFLATSSKVCAEIVQIFGNSKEYSTNNPTVDIIYSTLNFYSIISRVAILSPFETPEMEKNLLDFISLQKFFQINESIVDILISFSMGAELKISDEFYHIQIKNTSALSILISWCEGTRYLLDVFTMIQQLIKFSVANRYLLFKGNIVSLLLHNITETTNIIVMDILTDIFSFYFQKTELNELFNTLIKSSATIQLSLFQMIKTCICHDNTGTPSAFFHISQKNHNHHFTINGFHFDYPINISFFARFESCKDSTLIIISNSEELLKIQMRNSAMIIKTETEILHLFDSIPILGWQKVILSINNNAITISICGIGSSYMNNQDFKMTNMVVLKKTLFESNNKLTISDCDLDFDEFIIENLGYFSAKMVQNQRCINKYQSKVKANFFGIIIPYSLTINEVIAASGGILIMLPLFSIIPKNSYEHFSIVIDLLIHVLDNQKYHSYQPNLIRSLCAIFKKFDFSLSPKSISNKILNLTQILSSIEIDQYKRELEQYFFSDFELTSKFPGILPQSYIENPKLLNETLSLKEIFIHISLLKDENKIQYLPLLQSYVKQDFLKEEMGTFYYFSLVPDMVELTMTFLINNWGKIPHFNFAKIFSSESTKILLWGIKALSILVSKGLEEELLEQYILSIPAVWNNIQRPDFFLETLLSYLFHTSSDEMHEKLSFTFNFLEIYPFHNIQLLPIFCHVLPNSTISKQAVEYIFARLEQNTGEEIFKAPIWFTCLSYMSTFLEKNNNNFLKILGRIVASNPIKLFEPTIVHSFIICQICGTSFEQVVWQLSNVILSLPNESVISYDFILSLLLCLPKYSIKIEKPADFLSFVNESLLFSIDKIEYNPIIQENTHGLSEVLIHLFLLLLQALYKFHNNFLENAFSPFDNLGEAVAAILYYSPEEKVLEYLFSIDISMPEYMKRIMKCRDKIDRDSINHIDISTIELIVKHSDQFITTFSKWFKS
ncbi:hypothetical protein TRFO_23285 [Tritrichomonas foetus]|uniref:Beige/BEACH domain containing protein n=1 Tax=Tritrichomonas foetus TaxID=1144522 RepID=A0A1J4K9V7_9EUKA|nr:hypothetical protein TRFO_23285 [Tritrichomonas foetus]|eukprot:OHT08215.1 hypothetical protein TRFO_23285 [Tritrichomonas foetus]